MAFFVSSVWVHVSSSLSRILRQSDAWTSVIFNDCFFVRSSCCSHSKWMETVVIQCNLLINTNATSCCCCCCGCSAHGAHRILHISRSPLRSERNSNYLNKIPIQLQSHNSISFRRLARLVRATIGAYCSTLALIRVSFSRDLFDICIVFRSLCPVLEFAFIHVLHAKWCRRTKNVNSAIHLNSILTIDFYIFIALHANFLRNPSTYLPRVPVFLIVASSSFAVNEMCMCRTSSDSDDDLALVVMVINCNRECDERMRPKNDQNREWERTWLRCKRVVA